jgi:hypothetical protein
MDTTDLAVAARPKRWPVALLVGLITACVAVVAVVPIAEWGMEEHHVSNMEGGRGYAMVFCWMPLALLVAFLTGFVVSLLTSGHGFAGYLKRQALSLGVLAVLFGIGAAFSYSTANHPPLINDQSLALDIEVRVPRKARSVEDLQRQRFDVALVVSASDRNFADMRWAEARLEDDYIVVPAWAPLNSRNAGREITAGVEGESRQIFNVILRPSPKQIDEAWSEWAPPRERFDSSKPPPEDQYLARYRVRFESEYSPTPSPTATPSESPEAEATPAEDSPEPAETPE